MRYTQLKVKVGKILPSWAIKFIVKYIMPLIRPLERLVTKEIDYSKEFYDEVYHKDKLGLDRNSFEQIMAKWEREGFKVELYAVFDQIEISENRELKWLEVACMHGRTAWWLGEKYNNVFFYMFDFSKTAIEWIKKHNPIPERTLVWEGDIVNIQYNNQYFNAFFDFITCLDVTEHLPEDVYKEGIREMYRVLRSGGFLILKQGISVQPEHINVLTEERLVADFEKVGFVYKKSLPRRYHLFTKL